MQGIESIAALGRGLKVKSLSTQGLLQTRIESPDLTSLQAPIANKYLTPSMPLQTKEADLIEGKSNQLELTWYFALRTFTQKLSIPDKTHQANLSIITSLKLS